MKGTRTGFRSKGVDLPVGGDWSGKEEMPAIFDGCGNAVGLWRTDTSSRILGSTDVSGFLGKPSFTGSDLSVFAFGPTNGPF